MHDILSAFLRTFFRFENRFRIGFFVVAIVTTSFVNGETVFAAESVGTNPSLIDDLLLLLGEVAVMFATFLSKLVIQIIQVMIPIMTYNNFTNAPVVNAGWSIVRDTVNMFFVVVLIIIAFGTIFGNSKFQWQQQVPRLLKFAIIINFSKTLAGIMIDFGQVIMLTFANALQQIAAGNFVQLLGFTDIYAIGENNSTFAGVQNGTGVGVQPWDWFFAGAAAVLMMVIILATMIVMLALLIYRVIMLWILIVMAPLAWFVGGAKDIVQSNAYSEWWSKFKCLVAIGPVLTFFLWLTLAVAGAGNIAAKSGFDVAAQGELSNPGGVINKIFELDRFMSFLIALAMLWAGFEAAQQVCGNMPGFGSVKGRVDQVRGLMKRGAKFTGGVALKGTAGAGRLGLRGGRAIGRAAAPSVSKFASDVPVLSLLTKQGRATAGRALARNAGTGIIGRAVARKALGFAEAQEKKLAAQNAAYGKGFADLSTEAKVDQLKRMAKDPPGNERGRLQAASLFRQVMGDKSAMKVLARDGIDKELWEQFSPQIETLSKADLESADKLAAFKKTNAHFTDSLNDIRNEDDVKALSDEALKDDAVRKKLALINTKDKDDNGKLMTVAQKMEKGLYGDDKKKLFTASEQEATGVSLDNMSKQELYMVSSAVLAASGSETVLGRVADQSIAKNDLGKLDEVLGQLVEQMKKGSPEQRFNAQTKFDNLTAQLAKSSEKRDEGFRARMDTLLTEARGRRIDELGLGDQWKDLGRVHGSIPFKQLEAAPTQFINNAFKNASKARIEDAKSQINSQLPHMRAELPQVQDKAEETVQRAQERVRNSPAFESLYRDKAALDARINNSSEESLKRPAGKKLMEDRKNMEQQLTDMLEKDADVVAARTGVEKLKKQVDALTKGLEELNKLTPEEKKQAPAPPLSPSEAPLTEEELLAAGSLATRGKIRVKQAGRWVKGGVGNVGTKLGEKGTDIALGADQVTRDVAGSVGKWSGKQYKKVKNVVSPITPTEALKQIEEEEATAEEEARKKNNPDAWI